ncbi:MAG: type transport system ATP-binding protein [Chloroflexota bacterium]|jgi:ABC-2 type transport system ATP-binding protein|nr:type transport system ATP-binding protein [Chloroflexota bacterium]
MASVAPLLHGDIDDRGGPPAGPTSALRSPGIATRAIRSTGLTKMYGGIRAVDGLDLDVPRGSITGFVGPNGAGKTTTIRMLLGLIRPSGGSAEVLGENVSNPAAYLAQVGSLIEGPAFHPALSGRRNLEVLASLGGHTRARVDEVLQIVGLTDRARDRYRTYSLGMKQRLGVAAALLPDPELLVLDEPSNGLDPAGIIEMRVLLRSLRERGKTVFVSSHLLGEVEQLADWLVVLDHGRLLFQGPIADLLARRETRLRVAGESPADAEIIAAVARRLGYDAEVADGHVTVGAGPEAAAGLTRGAMGAGVALTEIGLERSTLEDSFLTLTGDN